MKTVIKTKQNGQVVLVVATASTHHLQVFGPGCALNDVWPRPDVINDGPVKPWKHKVSAFFINLSDKQLLSTLQPGEL